MLHNVHSLDDILWYTQEYNTTHVLNTTTPYNWLISTIASMFYRRIHTNTYNNPLNTKTHPNNVRIQCYSTLQCYAKFAMLQCSFCSTPWIQQPMNIYLDKRWGKREDRVSFKEEGREFQWRIVDEKMIEKSRSVASKWNQALDDDGACAHCCYKISKSPTTATYVGMVVE